MKAWMSSNFGKFETELLPLINVRIEYLLNILKTNRPIKTKKTVDFSETVAASDLKVSRSRQLIEFIKVCEY